MYVEMMTDDIFVGIRKYGSAQPADTICPYENELFRDQIQSTFAIWNFATIMLTTTNRCFDSIHQIIVSKRLKHSTFTLAHIIQTVSDTQTHIHTHIP